MTVKLGVDSFVAAVTDPATERVIGPVERFEHLLEEIQTADRSGLYSFGIGEHHRSEYYDAAPAVILAAAAARTTDIRMRSAVTVLSAADPVRVFQEYATVDLISGGRVELVVGRGSFTESFPLFGLSFGDYDELFTEKLDLLLKLRDDAVVTWSGKHRPAMHQQPVYPRPAQDPLPIWVGVGGTPESFLRAGLLGLPLMIAIIGGEARQFAPLVDLYRRAGAQAGHPPEQLKVGLHCFGFLGDDVAAATQAFYPGWQEMFTKIASERGGMPPSRRQFDATRGPDGAYFVGDPDMMVEKAQRVSEQLGGVDRINLQMTNPRLAHADLLHSIELLGEASAMLAGAGGNRGRIGAVEGSVMTVLPTWPDHLLDLDEWCALPEDSSHRLELAEGVLVVAARPIARHQKLIMRLAAQLDAARDGRFEVLPEYELVVDPGPAATVRVPDLVLAPAGLPDSTPRLAAADAVAVVEILSPGSRRLDRVLKHSEYAESGVPYYLLVEPGPPVSLSEFRRSGGAYEFLAEHRGRALLDLGVTLDLDALG